MSQKTLLTALADLGFLWVLLHFGMGGWENAVLLLTSLGVLSWVLLGLVVFLLVYRSDYRTDLPLFMAGLILGYWGEWWGTTRGVWVYWNDAAPPDYLPPLWGLGLLTVHRLSVLLAAVIPQDLPRWTRRLILASFALMPVLTLAGSWPLLAAVDWHGRLDAHFLAGLCIGILLVIYEFDLLRDFPLYLSGTIMGGLYEYLGTSMGEWTYITAEQPPLWIAPLWGLASVAMYKLALLIRGAAEASWRWIFSGPRDAKKAS